MSRLIVQVAHKENRDLPAIEVAAMYGAKAKALGHDTIRVEKLGGALVNEFPLTTVEHYVRLNRRVPQAGRVLRRDRGDYEFRRPVYLGWHKETS